MNEIYDFVSDASFCWYQLRHNFIKGFTVQMINRFSTTIFCGSCSWLCVLGGIYFYRGLSYRVVWKIICDGFDLFDDNANNNGISGYRAVLLVRASGHEGESKMLSRWWFEIETEQEQKKVKLNIRSAITETRVHGSNWHIDGDIGVWYHLVLNYGLESIDTWTERDI